MRGPQDLIVFVGRICMASWFLLLAWERVFDWETTSQQIAGQDLPKSDLLMVAALVLVLFGSVSLISGFKTGAGVLALLLFLVPATFVFHAYWTYANPLDRNLHQLAFFKNLAVAGGLCLLLAFGPGRLSMDHRRQMRTR